jgi:hypothetical protein
MGWGPHPRSNNMTPHFLEEFSTQLIDWSPFVIMGNTMPPRDPDEDDENEEEEEEEEDEDEDDEERADDGLGDRRPPRLSGSS